MYFTKTIDSYKYFLYNVATTEKGGPHMKKIIILFFLICAIPLSACSKAPEQVPAPTVQRLTSPLELSEDEAATLIQCCGENGALLAVGHRNTAQTGPLYHTDYLLYWNYSDGTTKQFPVSSPAYIISAVLDGSDVLYVDYEAMDSGLKWSLIRSTDTGKSTLATGQVSSYDQVPALFCLNGQPMYLQSEDTGISVYHVDGSAVSSVLNLTDYTMSDVTVCTNGTQFAFLASANDDAYWTAFLCNASGILYQKELSQQVTTFAITGEYMVCGLGDPETQKFSYETIRISDGKVSAADSAVPLWRLAGSGSSCMYVDDTFAAHILYPDTQQTDPLVINDFATYQNWPTVFCPDGVGGYLVEMDIEDTSTYWHITT